MTRILLSLLAFYQRWISPALHALSGGAGCRFVPTCSEYAVVAIETHGPVRGSGLAIRRLLRCHPFSRGGLDQVPVLGANAKGRLAPASQPGGRLPHEPLT